MLYSAAQLTYLEHLGIDVWVPKDMPIVVAAAALPQEIPSEPVVVAVNEATGYIAPSHFEDVPATNQAAAVAPPYRPVKTPVDSVVSVNSPMAPSPLSSALSSAIAAPAFPTPSVDNAINVMSRVEFNIQFWCYSSGVWLVSGDVNITPEQHKLVHNLAQFIQGKKRRPRHVNVFSWPMIDSPNVDQGEDIASKYVLAHIERLQQACDKNKVIVFNDCDYFPSQIPHIKLDVSLQQLLLEPMAKKALWQQLIPHRLDD